MLSINDKFPDFKLETAKQGKNVQMSSDDFKGSWTIIFFYPEDFSFICPTEVTGFEKQRKYLKDMDAQLIGISVDSVDTHIKWQEEVNVNYPLGSDIGGELSKKVGVLDTSDNRSHRATFILDPDFVIHFAMITSRNVGRSVEETIRVFNAIKSEKKCPAEYDPRTMTEGDIDA